MEKAQEARFRQGALQSAICAVRMDLYNKRTNRVKEKMPVFEAMLKKRKKQK